jgi:hypothetical protein
MGFTGTATRCIIGALTALSCLIYLPLLISLNYDVLASLGQDEDTAPQQISVLDSSLTSLPPIPPEDQLLKSRKASNEAAIYPLQEIKAPISATKNKTLVILTGSIRGGEETWQTLYNNVLDLNGADLMLVVGQVPPENRTSSVYQRANYIYEFPEYDDWYDAIELIAQHTNSTTTPWREFINQTEGHLFGGVKGVNGSGAIVFMARWFASRAIETYGLTSIYDRFIVTRPDTYYACRHDISILNSSQVWVPLGEDWRGLCDRYFLCNNRQILDALDMLPAVVKDPDAIKLVGLYNSEMFLKKRWTMNGLWGSVRRFPRTMFRASVAGDTTRWTKRSERGTKYPGIRMKYLNEYRATLCNCEGGEWKYLPNPVTKEAERKSFCQKNEKDKPKQQMNTTA